MFFTTTVTWEAPSFGSKVLYLVQILKSKTKTKQKQIKKKRRLNLEKLDVKSFLQTQCIDKVGKG